jgi:hypothetical protein
MRRNDCGGRRRGLGSPYHHAEQGHLVDPHRPRCRCHCRCRCSVRGSSSSPEAAQAGESVIEPSTTTALPVQTATEPLATTAPVASTEPVDATSTAIESTAPERLPLCDTEQLRPTFTVWEGLAAVVLRRVKGQPCHHGRAPIGFTVRDQSGDRVAVFPGNVRATQPADFSKGFEQLLEIPVMSCDPEGSFLVVATVGPYVVRRTVPGAELPCNHH